MTRAELAHEQSPEGAPRARLHEGEAGSVDRRRQRKNAAGGEDRIGRAGNDEPHRRIGPYLGRAEENRRGQGCRRAPAQSSLSAKAAMSVASKR